MTFIVALSLIGIAIVVTILLIGISTVNTDLIVAGWMLIVALVIIHLAFQSGTYWQRLDTLEKYQLIPKS